MSSCRHVEINYVVMSTSSDNIICRHVDLFMSCYCMYFVILLSRHNDLICVVMSKMYRTSTIYYSSYVFSGEGPHSSVLPAF
jgi:hypothetical protein